MTQEYYKKKWEESLASADHDAFKVGIRYGFKKAIDALRMYREESEEVTTCLHSREWANWLELNKEEILK